MNKHESNQVKFMKNESSKEKHIPSKALYKQKYTTPLKKKKRKNEYNAEEEAR